MASQKHQMSHVQIHYGHQVHQGYEGTTDPTQMFHLLFLKARWWACHHISILVIGVTLEILPMWVEYFCVPEQHLYSFTQNAVWVVVYLCFIYIGNKNLQLK